MGRIVVGVDGSSPSRAALRWAAAEAERAGSSLEVVMAWDDPSRYMWVPHVPPAGDPVADLHVTLNRFAASVVGDDPGVPVHSHVVEGPAATVLLDAAQGADLLVVGNRGRGGVAGTVLGSVSLRCAAAAPCPVVVVRGAPGDGPPGRREGAPEGVGAASPGATS